MRGSVGAGILRPLKKRVKGKEMTKDNGFMDGQFPIKELLAVVNWPGGKVRLRCTGVDCDNDAAEKVTEALEQLATGWHLRFIWFFGVLKNREAMQRDIAENIGRDERVSFGCEYPDGSRRYIQTSVNGSEAVSSFSDDMFGKLIARSFVLSIFSHWEDTIRPEIVEAIGVPIQEAESDLMGELRLLRNWLEHPSPGGDAERQYFRRAKILTSLLHSQPGKPEVSVGGVYLLMGQLNALSITVDPIKQGPMIEFVTPDPETLFKIQGQLGPNDRIISW